MVEIWLQNILLFMAPPLFMKNAIIFNTKIKSEHAELSHCIMKTTITLSYSKIMNSRWCQWHRIFLFIILNVDHLCTIDNWYTYFLLSRGRFHSIYQIRQCQIWRPDLPFFTISIMTAILINMLPASFIIRI